MEPIEPVVATEDEIEEYSCQKCKSKFNSQLELASHMTNINCNPVMTARCLLCDIEVGSLILYKSHLVGTVSKYNFLNNIFWTHTRCKHKFDHELFSNIIFLF